MVLRLLKIPLMKIMHFSYYSFNWNYFLEIGKYWQWGVQKEFQKKNWGFTLNQIDKQQNLKRNGN